MPLNNPTDLASPAPIGSTTPNTVAATTVNASSSTASTSTTTGAIVTPGGCGFGGSLFLGGGVNAISAALRSGSFTATIAPATLNANRTHLQPDADGTYALAGSTTPYTTPGTYSLTIPATAKFCRLYLVGSGAGSGSGRLGAASTLRCGGASGGAGAVSEAIFSVADLLALGGTSLSIVVPSGGSGGASQTTADTNGNPGTNGGAATVTCNGILILQATGGSAGLGGTNSAGGSPSLGGATGVYKGASGLQPTAVNGASGVSDNNSPGSGGSGASLDATQTSRPGGQGGKGAASRSNTAAPANGGSNGTGGASTTAPSILTNPGDGAGGGGVNGSTPLSGAGGNGFNGSSGGGGAGGANGFSSGAGGNGGNGVALGQFY